MGGVASSKIYKIEQKQNLWFFGSCNENLPYPGGRRVRTSHVPPVQTLHKLCKIPPKSLQYKGFSSVAETCQI